MAICQHCKATVFWVKEVPFDRGTIQHMCQEYLTALLNGTDNRNVPNNWAYVPKTVSEQRKNLHKTA